MPFKRDDEGWEQKFKELEEYKEEHGDCNVPQRYPDNPSLARWVKTQRQFKKEGKLSGDRKRRLEEAGFAFELRLAYDKKWEQKFKELEAYKKEHGDCNVPQVYADNPSLGRWVDTQREFKKGKRLSDDRKRRLEEVGFNFVLRRSWDGRRPSSRVAGNDGDAAADTNDGAASISEGWDSVVKGKGGIPNEIAPSAARRTLKSAGRRSNNSSPSAHMQNPSGLWDCLEEAPKKGRVANRPSGSKGWDSAIEGEGGSAVEIAPSAARRILRSAGGDRLGPTSGMSERENASKVRVERAKRRQNVPEGEAQAEGTVTGLGVADQRPVEQTESQGRLIEEMRRLREELDEAKTEIKGLRQKVHELEERWEGGNAGEGRLRAGGGVLGSMSPNEQKTACL